MSAKLSPLAMANNGQLVDTGDGLLFERLRDDRDEPLLLTDRHPVSEWQRCADKYFDRTVTDISAVAAAKGST